MYQLVVTSVAAFVLPLQRLRMYFAPLDDTATNGGLESEGKCSRNLLLLLD